MTRTARLFASSLLLVACDATAPLRDAGAHDASASVDAALDAGSADGGVGCIPVTVTGWRLAEQDDVSIRYRARIAPELRGEAWDLNLWFLRYDVQYVGTFPLGEGPEENFGTCARCVVAYTGADWAHGFFADEGALESRVDPFTQELDVALRDVRLIEVTFEGETITSVPVPGGRCLRLAAADVAQVFPSAGWRCPAEQFRDGTTCNCNCGAWDPDCDEPSRPLAGCMADDVCTFTAECSQTCDHPGREACTRGGVCGYSAEGDRCLDPATERVDSAAVGETCAPGNFLCGVDAEGFAMGVCDGDLLWECKPTCGRDADCAAVPGEICLTLFGAPGAERGYCRPPFPPEG